MEVSEILKKEKEVIIDRWIDDLHLQIPSVKNYEDAALHNSIPDLLEAMIEAVKIQRRDGVVFHSQSHGQGRAGLQAYSLSHVIAEYHLLRKSIFAILDKYDGIERKDRDTIIFVIDQAIEQAADTYYRIREQVLVDAKDIARKKADELELQDVNRERFIQSISHDLNNPLNNVKACIQLLEDDLGVEEVPSILNIIKRSVNTATLLIEDFLDVTAVNGDEPLPLSKTSVNISDDLKKEVSVFEMIYKRDIEFDDGGEEVFGKVDPRQLRRAFGNLMNNALKHSVEQTVIRVQCKLVDEEIKIVVNNQGKIPADILANIFDRYYQLDKTGKGWGIGLSYVREVAEAHEGSIEVSSNEEGVTFTMIIQQQQDIKND